MHVAHSKTLKQSYEEALLGEEWRS